MARKRLTRKKVNDPVIDTALRDIYDKLDTMQPEVAGKTSKLAPQIGDTQLVETPSGQTMMSSYTEDGWMIDMNSNYTPTSNLKGFEPALGTHGKSRTPIQGEALKYDRNKTIPISNDKKEKILLKNTGNKLNIRNANDSTDIQLEIKHGGTGASTEDAALGNLGGTATGKSVFTAADQAAARSAIGAGTSSFDGAYGSLSSIPSTFAPIIGTDSDEALAGNTSIPPDLTQSGAGTVHASNYTDTNTQLDKAGVEGLEIQEVGELTSGSIGSGFTTIPIARTAAKVESISVSGTGVSRNTSTGDVTITIAPNTVAGAISANTLAWSQMADLTENKAPVINGDGEMTASAVTATELGHLDGVTGAIQTQLASKASLAGASFTGKIATNSPIGFSHHALTDVSINQSTYDFDFGTNGNKIRLAFTGGDVTIAKAQLIFPTNISGNYTVLVKNHTSAITKNEITAWYSHFGTAGTDETIVKWPNGAIPSVTESATGRMDIFSFYWDCNEKIAYGVSTLNFAS